MSFVPARCGTLLIPTGPTGNHLLVIATDACSEGKHLLVNLSTIYSGAFYDDTCVVQAGEHPFVKAPSFAVYRSAMIQTGDRLTQMVDGWVYKAHHDATDALTARILAGALASRLTPRHVKNYLSAN